MDQLFRKEYRLLGLNIAYYRKSKELTQMQLAEELDISRTHMGRIELGLVGVSLDVLFAIADILDVPVYKFFQFRE